MKWLSIQEVSKRSGKSERTLRLYAAQGKIKAEKDGKGWMCELSSLKKAGIIIAEDVALPIIAEKSTALPRQSGNIAESSAKTAARGTKKTVTKKKRTYQTLEDLGVYRDLTEIWFEYSLTDMDEVAKWIKYTMEHIALGFYEYTPERKAVFFRHAREGLVKAIVGLKIQNKKSGAKYAPCLEGLETEILSGVIGLIRRAEKRIAPSGNSVEARG